MSSHECPVMIGCAFGNGSHEREATHDIENITAFDRAGLIAPVHACGSCCNTVKGRTLNRWLLPCGMQD